MKTFVKSLLLAVAVSSVAGTAFADSTDATDTTKAAADYVYPLQGGVDYNKMPADWKVVHGSDVRTENLGQNG
jgi:hypothetical protein